MSSTNCTITPVVLCGGSGTRLWPLSRTLHPKQLLSLINDKSMLQNTLLRVQGMLNHARPMVICNHEYRFIVAEQLRDAGFEKSDIFLEPEGKNTAPAVTIVALHSLRQNEDPLLMVMPADHDIANIDQLEKTIEAGIELANQNYLVTFGVTPNKPETGYGYILKSDPLPQSSGYRVEQFVEKPSITKAKEYVASGDYFWNSGMFLFRASVFIKAMREFAPDILESCEQAVADMGVDLDFYRLNEKFLSCRSESIDFAVMEKADNIAVVPLQSEWSDVGSWDVLWQISQKDDAGNVLRGQVFVDQVSDSYLRAEKRLLAVVGLSNIAVIETPDAVLVAHKDSCQDIKTMVGLLKGNQRAEAHTHDCVYRPWGYYEALNKSDRYHVKHIVVKPGAKLSLQMHQHRSEHWVIIKGTAVVTRGDEQFELSENQSIYIPANVKHRIENNTDSLLHFIEVQTGNYFGEDDIVRFEDIYGRKETDSDNILSLDLADKAGLVA